MRPIPAFQLRLADGVPFILRSMFQPEAAPLVFVIGLKVFAKRNANALALVEFAILNDPSLCPVRANHALLIGCRRRPLRRCLAKNKAGERDGMDTRFHGVEAMAARAVLQKMTIRRTAEQMKIEGRFCLCAFAHPHIAGEFHIPRIRRRFSGKQRLPRENLAQGSVVKIYICPVYRLGGIIVVPVA